MRQACKWLIVTRADWSWNGRLRIPLTFRILVRSSKPTVELEAHQIHDLADLVPELMEASAGYRLKFRIQIVLDDTPEDVRTGIDQLIVSRLQTEPDRET